jgi:hypothetical protein
MVTVKEIMENARKFGRDGKSQAVEFDQILQHQYDLSQKRIYFTIQFRGSTSLYNTRVAIYDVEPNGITPEEIKAGKYPMPKDFVNCRIKVDCDCKDYTLGGALKGNLKHDAALFTDAELTNYKKKTDRQEKNPDNLPYCCKHIYSMLEALIEHFGSK